MVTDQRNSSMKTFLLFIVFICVQECFSSYASMKFDTLEDFTYAGNREQQFSAYPKCKSGLRQSPIDLSPPFLNSPLRTRLVIGRGYYKNITDAIVTNPGYVPYIILPRGVDPPKVYFNGVRYIFNHIAIHTGENDTVGSGHLLNGVQYPLSAYFVHFQPKYRNIREALNHDMGVLSIAVVHRLAPPDNVDKVESAIADVFPKIRKAGQTTLIHPNIKLISRFPEDKSFYFYKGSMDVPKCKETVGWVVFKHTSTVSKGTLKKFRNVLKNKRGQFILKNWRFVQERNGRHIYQSRAIEDKYGMNSGIRYFG